MKMQKPAIEFVSFGTNDVIATSGPILYAFNGLGSDKTDLYGRDLSITKGGADVTDSYIFEGSSYYISQTTGMRGYSLSPSGASMAEYVDTHSSTDLVNSGNVVTDGDYVLDSENGGTTDKFVPYAGN